MQPVWPPVDLGEVTWSFNGKYLQVEKIHDGYKSSSGLQQRYPKCSRKSNVLLHISDSTGLKMVIEAATRMACSGGGVTQKDYITAAHKTTVPNSTFGENERTAHQH